MQKQARKCESNPKKTHWYGIGGKVGTSESENFKESCGESLEERDRGVTHNSLLHVSVW